MSEIPSESKCHTNAALVSSCRGLPRIAGVGVRLPAFADFASTMTLDMTLDVVGIAFEGTWGGGLFEACDRFGEERGT